VGGRKSDLEDRSVAVGAAGIPSQAFLIRNVQVRLFVGVDHDAASRKKTADSILCHWDFSIARLTNIQVDQSRNKQGPTSAGGRWGEQLRPVEAAIITPRKLGGQDKILNYPR
jgi:hypothetical protein